MLRAGSCRDDDQTLSPAVERGEERRERG